MKNPFFLFSILCFLCYVSFAEQTKIDSLDNLLKTVKEDTNKVNILNSLAREYRKINTEKAIEMAKHALEVSRKINFKKGIGLSLVSAGNMNEMIGKNDTALKQYFEALDIFKIINDEFQIANTQNTIGEYYRMQGDYDKAMEFYSQSLIIKENLNDKIGIAATLNNMGIVFYRKGDYDKTMEYYIKSLKLREEINDQEGIATSLGNIGLVYYEQGNYTKALEHHQKSLELYEKLGIKRSIARTLMNIGIVYVESSKLEKALQYFLQSLKIYEELNIRNGIANNLHNIGNIYNDLDSLDKAIKYFEKSLPLFKELGDKQNVSLNLTNLGLVYTSQSQFTKAISTLTEALTLAKEIDSKPEIRDSYKNLSIVYEKLKNYKNAYAYHQLFSQMKDSILNEESSKQIAEMQTKYETEKKEQQITLLNKDKELQNAQLNRQQIIIWSVAGGLLVVLVLSIFIFRERKKSEKLLLNILPAETAKELKTNGKARAKHYESVTVMFTDFKGFTTIAEKLSAEELVSELDFLFKKFDEIISGYNIEKIKTIGDAYMCASGLPSLNPNHAVDIVKAGIEIQSWMREQNNKWSLRMGIHSGPVTAGVVGDKKFAYDIWGDTVNIASRMESSGEAGKINISGSTYEFIYPLLKERGWGVRHRGKIPAKNKGEIEMYYIERSEIQQEGVVAKQS